VFETTNSRQSTPATECETNLPSPSSTETDSGDEESAADIEFEAEISDVQLLTVIASIALNFIGPSQGVQERKNRMYVHRTGQCL
jgi:hypothetical protein